MLWDAVAPGGLLVFSTHGVKAAAFDSVALDEEGLALSSESNAIDAQEYGTAFTSGSLCAAAHGRNLRHGCPGARRALLEPPGCVCAAPGLRLCAVRAVVNKKGGAAMSWMLRLQERLWGLAP